MYESAIEELRTVTLHEPAHPGAWQKLSELLRWAGEDSAADEAGLAARRWADEAPKWLPARDTRKPGEIEAAEHRLGEHRSSMDRVGQMEMLREHLLENPNDAAATHMLSRLEWQNGDQLTAQTLLERTLELSPFYHPARAELALLLIRRTYFIRALEHAEILRRQLPGNADYGAIYSDALQCVGDYQAALAVAEELLREHPEHPRFWYGYGLLLHYVGGRDDSARAFRTCLETAPTLGEAWWGLADLKGGFITDVDVEAMRNYLANPGLKPSSRMYMYYALGHAMERAGDYSASFNAYQQGACLFRGQFLGRGEAYSEDEFVERVQDVKRIFTAHNLATLAGSPAAQPVATPIFIVGMPRAGSTLLEQILASHSLVEATRELPTISDIVRDLALGRRAITPNAYPDCLLEMGPAELAALGERYLREARRYRKTENQFFIDKQPWNWLETGLIHLILPEAKIIDVRREPMAACFAMFKQVLTNGADFSYDLHDLGRYYIEYAGLMEHWQSVMPGRIHFVQYERLVEDTETEIRRLLDYCGLPFEENCLRFWETKRAISTPSAEQVRRPIFRDALEQWRNFEPWLGPLKEALSHAARAHSG
jgi:tetratricopeptide (TPR) repeat protein